jgi:hypothetical protein
MLDRSDELAAAISSFVTGSGGTDR